MTYDEDFPWCRRAAMLVEGRGLGSGSHHQKGVRWCHSPEHFWKTYMRFVALNCICCIKIINFFLFIISFFPFFFFSFFSLLSFSSERSHLAAPLPWSFDPLRVFSEFGIFNWDCCNLKSAQSKKVITPRGKLSSGPKKYTYPEFSYVTKYLTCLEFDIGKLYVGMHL